jgi:hypothetical protein
LRKKTFKEKRRQKKIENGERKIIWARDQKINQLQGNAKQLNWHFSKLLIL